MRRGLTAAALGALVAGVIAATAVGNPAAPTASAQLAACTNVSLGFLGPLTGWGRSVGREQLSWLRFGVQKYNKAAGTRFGVVPGNTRLKTSVARTEARRLIRNANVLSVIGGSESRAVRASGKLLAAASLASISGSARAVDLTKGHPYKTFFRVVPNDGVQHRDIVDFVSGKLGAKNVLVLDSEDEYSAPLANAIARGLRSKGISVSEESVPANAVEFTDVVATVDSSVDLVVFATEVASAANTLANQLREQGKRAVVVGTDGAYSPEQFKPRKGYVSSFAPDLHFDRNARPIVREYGSFVDKDTSGAFGPATYMAGWVAMDAIRKACKDGAVSRAEVVAFVRKTNVASIIGAPIRFDGKGDLRGGGRFAIYKITSGKYAPVSY